MNTRSDGDDDGITGPDDIIYSCSACATYDIDIVLLRNCAGSKSECALLPSCQKQFFLTEYKTIAPFLFPVLIRIYVFATCTYVTYRVLFLKNVLCFFTNISLQYCFPSRGTIKSTANEHRSLLACKVAKAERERKAALSSKFAAPGNRGKLLFYSKYSEQMRNPNIST